VELRPFRNEYYTMVNYQRKYTNMLGPTFGGGSDFKISNSFDKVGRCRLTLSKPVLKAPLVSVLEAKI
jgi:hypothetical protein